MRLLAGSAPLQWQRQFPTAAEADNWLADQIASRSKTSDANDMIYYFRASEDYNPAPHAEEITAPLLAINSADDFIKSAGDTDDGTGDRQGETREFREHSDFGPDAWAWLAVNPGALGRRAGALP